MDPTITAYDEVLPSELARLRAIEQAAREYRTAYQRDDIWGDEWQIACVDARSRLFALLDSPPVQ